MPLRVGSNESALSLQIGVSRHVFTIACPERVLAKSAVLHRNATVFRLKYARSHARISSISATGYDPSPTTDDAFACRTVSFLRHADDGDAQQTGWGCSSPSAKIPVLTQKTHQKRIVAYCHPTLGLAESACLLHMEEKWACVCCNNHLARHASRAAANDRHTTTASSLKVSLSHVLSEAFLPQEMRSRQHYILPAAPILEPIDPSDRAHAEHSVGLPYYARGPPAVCTTRTLTSGPRLNQLGCGIRKSRSLK